MTTRRQFIGLCGGAAGLALAGSAVAATRPAPPERPAPAEPAVPDLLLADTTAGLAVLHGTRRAVLPAAVGTPDGTLLWTASGGPDSTVVRTVRAATGTAAGSFTLAGRWLPRVVSPDGRWAALTGPPAGEAHRPPPRERTTIVVADAAGPRHRVELAGNYQPDAFTRDARGLFVLDWLPPTAPERYRVRLLDLATGVPAALVTRDKTAVPAGAEEEMRGDGRHAVLSPDGNTLFTLYTHQPDHQHTRDLLAGGRDSAVHAFVHVLHLEQGWAYCLDLPAPFGHGPAAGHTLAVTPDGRTLLVADAGSGRLLVADTTTLTVRRVVAGPTGTGPASSAVSPDGRWLQVAAGTAVTAMDLARFRVSPGRDTGAAVRGVSVSLDGRRLYVGTPGAVRWFDVATGVVLGSAPVAGLTELRQTGLPAR